MLTKEDIEILAKDLHEAGREAVLKNKVHKKDGAPIGKIIFKEWDEISEEAKEGRRIQARWLLSHYLMTPTMTDNEGIRWVKAYTE